MFLFLFFGKMSYIPDGTYKYQDVFGPLKISKIKYLRHMLYVCPKQYNNILFKNTFHSELNSVNKRLKAGLNLKLNVWWAEKHLLIFCVTF